jgi:hypothetical protein
MSNKRYRLLKDLPDCRINTVGELDDDGKYYVFKKSRPSIHPDWHYPKETVEKNPDFFEEVVEPERVDVTKIETAGFSDYGNWYKFHIAAAPGKPWPFIEPNQFPAIKQAIEQVLNNEVGLLGVTVLSPNQPKYTEADLDKARREGVSNGETMYSLEDVRKALHGEWGTGNAVENVLNRLRNYKK